MLGHQPPISIAIQIRRIRLAGHCWRSKEELISDVFLWIPLHGRASVGWPTRTYLQQLCTDTGYSLEDLQEAMDDRDKWRERVREIRAISTWWWWWWWYINEWIDLVYLVSLFNGISTFVGYLMPKPFS